MKNISIENIENLTDDEITYMLYLEGKDIKSISIIRNMDKSSVEKSIIECKAKYRAFEGAKDVNDIINKLMKYSKPERIGYITSLTEEEKDKAEKYCCDCLFKCTKNECSFYIWFLGEIKSVKSIDYIKTFLKCSDGNIKRMCCSALGKIGDMKAEDVLIECSYDKHPQVRQYAIKALENIKSKKAARRFEEIANDENEKDYVRRAAKSAIDKKYS